jgi:arylsulfatase
MLRPNILWICTDQQRWDTLGCYDNPFVALPILTGSPRKAPSSSIAIAKVPCVRPAV